MVLSPAERLIIQLICDLAQPANKREFDYDFISKAVGWRHEWALTWKYDFLRDDAEETPADVTQVANILDM